MESNRIIQVEDNFDQSQRSAGLRDAPRVTQYNLYFTQKNSISSPTGPTQNPTLAGYGGTDPMMTSFGSTVTA